MPYIHSKTIPAPYAKIADLRTNSKDQKYARDNLAKYQWLLNVVVENYLSREKYGPVGQTSLPSSF